jgi:predicted nuclease of predicted toxin-antitoxin system
MARLYSNENFPSMVVDALRELGHDVLTSHESGNANQSIPDDQVLAFATKQGRVLLTFDRDDFKRLHRANPNHAGIVICTFDSNWTALAQRIDTELANTHELNGQLIRVVKPQSLENT